MVCNADTKTCGLEKFGKLFPNREFSFGIAEQNLVGASAGLAACGNKVFLATFAVFASMRACEQVRTFVCYPNLNVTVIGTSTAFFSRMPETIMVMSAPLSTTVWALPHSNLYVSPRPWWDASKTLSRPSGGGSEKTFRCLNVT